MDAPEYFEEYKLRLQKLKPDYKARKAILYGEETCPEEEHDPAMDHSDAAISRGGKRWPDQVKPFRIVKTGRYKRDLDGKLKPYTIDTPKFCRYLHHKEKNAMWKVQRRHAMERRFESRMSPLERSTRAIRDFAKFILRRSSDGEEKQEVGAFKENGKWKV